MKDWLRGRRLSLPHLTLFAQQAAPAGLPPASLAPGAVGARPQARQANILVVMLDGCTLGRLTQGLAGAAYQVTVICGLPPVLEALARIRPDLVIVCGLPASPVYEALRRATAAPILALLTQAAEADTLNILAAGADDCQPASIGNQELLSRVRTLLRRAG